MVAGGYGGVFRSVLESLPEFVGGYVNMKIVEPAAFIVVCIGVMAATMLRRNTPGEMDHTRQSPLRLSIGSRAA